MLWHDDYGGSTLAGLVESRQVLLVLCWSFLDRRRLCSRVVFEWSNVCHEEMIRDESMSCIEENRLSTCRWCSWFSSKWMQLKIFHHRVTGGYLGIPSMFWCLPSHLGRTSFQRSFCSYDAGLANWCEWSVFGCWFTSDNFCHHYFSEGTGTYAWYTLGN